MAQDTSNTPPADPPPAGEVDSPEEAVDEEAIDEAAREAGDEAAREDAAEEAAEAQGVATDELSLDGPLAEELRNYWSIERDLPIVKNRLYSRDDKFLVGIYGGILPSEQFVTYYPVGGRLGYFFSNHFGLEASGQYEFAVNKNITDFVQRERGTGFVLAEDTSDVFTWRANLMASWHPFYGKWALLQKKLSHFDISFAAGLGALGLDRPNPTRTGSDSSVALDVIVGAGFHFFLAENATLRLDWRTHAYLGPEFTTPQYEEQGFFDRVELPTEFLLGLSYMF